MWRVRARLTDPSSNQRVLTANEKKHVTWFATLDGSLGKFIVLIKTTVDLTLIDYFYSCYDMQV